MIYLIRHGQSEGNVQKRYCGITDVLLSKTGKLQAAHAGEKLKDFNVEYIYTSPLNRALDTARIISDISGGKIVKYDCLKEINFGIFENKTWEEMKSKFPYETDEWMKLGNQYKFPEGESYEDVIGRVTDLAKSIDDDTAIVSHFGVIQSLLIHWGIANYDDIWNYRISNCDIIVISKGKTDNLGKIYKIVEIIKCRL